MSNNRRDFLKTTTAAAAAASVPYIWTSSYAKAEDKNSKLTVASVGVGGSRGRYSRGGKIANEAASLGHTIAVCDVDDRHTSEFSKRHGGKLEMFRDYRKMFDKVKPDVVTIGTPDHWHVPIAIHALRAGADVYCEKPLTLTIDEGKQVCRVVKETGKVFQVGTQQRTEMGQLFLKAIAVVQSGVLGNDVKAHVAIGGAPGCDPFGAEEIPADLDWNMWVGPANEAAYNEKRRKMFRWFFEYSGGKMTDWGAHHIDIATWALGKDATGPVAVSGKGNFPSQIGDRFDPVAFLAGRIKLPNAFNTAQRFNIELKYADGAVMTVNDTYVSADGKTKFGNGILFEGSKGRIFVNRGKLTGKPVEGMSSGDQVKLTEAVAKLYRGMKQGSHMRNFFACVESRKLPISDVYTHHRTMTSCHLCNINLLLGRDLKWDPKKEDFIGDDQATALMTRPRRKGFEMMG